MKHLQEIICGTAGAVGGAIAAAFGGWSNDLTVLVAFMVIDYIEVLRFRAAKSRQSRRSKTSASTLA